MASFAFLSDEWISNAHAIIAGSGLEAPKVAVAMKMNLVIKELPFEPTVMQAHVDTTSGKLDVSRGHLVGPDLTVSLDYDTARTILIDGGPEAAMSAFMGGRIRVDGDITKLLALQSLAAPDGPATSGTAGDSNGGFAALAEVAQQIHEMTAP